MCLASYNGERFIGEQLRSALAQLGGEDEIVVSDDGSTDRTREIVASIGDRRVRLVENKTGRHGVNANFENALRHSSGEVVFLADQDDVWLPGKVEACMKALERNDCVIHDAIITDGELHPTGETFFRMVGAGRGVLRNWIHNGYLGCAMAFRRRLLNLALPFPEHMPMYHDIWLGTLAGIRFRVEFIDFKGIMFRRHDSTTSITFHRRSPWHRIILNRMGILWYAGKRLLLRRHMRALSTDL